MIFILIYYIIIIFIILYKIYKRLIINIIISKIKRLQSNQNLILDNIKNSILFINKKFNLNIYEILFKISIKITKHYIKYAIHNDCVLYIVLICYVILFLYMIIYYIEKKRKKRNNIYNDIPLNKNKGYITNIKYLEEDILG